jgi:hypothetical protein
VMGVGEYAEAWIVTWDAAWAGSAIRRSDANDTATMKLRRMGAAPFSAMNATVLRTACRLGSSGSVSPDVA